MTMSPNRLGVARWLGAGLFVLAASGCASLTPGSGFAPVEQIVRQHLDRRLARTLEPAQREQTAGELAGLLARPLSADDAVQIALLNNRGLQAAFFDLDIAQADLEGAGRLPNPQLSLLRASRVTDGVREFKIEQALVFNLFALVTMPQAQAIERRRFEQTQRAVALEVLQLAAQTRKAYYEALAAAERLHYRGQVNEAAAAGAELARRMAEAGNWSALQRAREHRFEAEAALQLALARHSHTAARERLARLLGLWGRDIAFQLPARLPDLPAQAAELSDIEQRAIGQRIDLQIARIEIDALADTLGLTRTNRFINVFEAGPARVLEGERGAGYKRGYEIRFELPVFDWGSARVARAQAIYLQSVERAAQAAIEARSQVREAYGTYRTRWDIARHHRQEMIPISQRISEENGLRYNGMLIGVFELLADTREQIATVIEAIDAARDFWIAQADLDMTMLGSPESDPLARSHR